MYKHYIKIRNSDKAILDGVSSAFHQDQNLDDYTVFQETKERHFRQDWFDRNGLPKFKLEKGEIVEREYNQDEFDYIQEQQDNAALMDGNFILKAISEIDTDGTISLETSEKIEKLKKLKGL